MPTSSPTSFYWFDYETFGLDRFRDRPAQFSGQRTDEDLEPVGDPAVLYCRPSTDFLPSPESCLLTGITPQEAEEKGLTEAEFADRIQAEFSQPGTLSVGYNSFGFDDEVTRFLFWRCLLDPYEREWRNGCGRWDLFPFVRAVWALRPEGIVWPEVTDEKTGAKRPSFRLEVLSKANGLAHEHAHDAHSDVEATIGLARLLKARQPRLWAWALANRTKDRVRAQIDKARESGTPFLWVDPHAGPERGYLRLAVPAATSPFNKNEVLVWDCREDPSVLEGLSAEEIAVRAFAPRRKLEELGLGRLPLCRLRLNASPFVCADLRVLSAQTCGRFGVDMVQVTENARRLSAMAGRLAQTCVEALESVRPKEASEPLDPEIALYQGALPETGDKGLMQRVHSLAPQALAEAVSQGRFAFEDRRLSELLTRYRARNWPETLTEEESRAWKEHCRSRVMEGKSGFRPLSDFQESVDALMARLDARIEAGEITQEQYERSEAVLQSLYEWSETVCGRIES